MQDGIMIQQWALTDDKMCLPCCFTTIRNKTQYLRIITNTECKIEISTNGVQIGPASSSTFEMDSLMRLALLTDLKPIIFYPTNCIFNEGSVTPGFHHDYETYNQECEQIETKWLIV